VSLTSGTGPLSARRAGRFTAPVPDGVAYVEPFRRRVRGVHGGRSAVDSERALLVHRPGHPPIWAFPERDVHGVRAVPVPEAPGHVEVPWDAVDAWYQEDDPVFLHAPNPYHRVECVHTSRHVRVEVGGVALVDAGLHPHPRLVRRRVEVPDHLEAGRLRQPVDGGDVEQHVEREVVLERAHHRHDLVPAELQHQHAVRHARRGGRRQA